MKKTTKVFGIATVLCLLAVAAVPASASFGNADDARGPLALLDEIEAAGYDVADIRTAFENEDFENARALMQQFMETHQSEFAPKHDGTKSGMGQSALLDRIEAAGYDITEIRAAFENGDAETGRTLLQQFMEEHQGEFAPSQGGENTGNGMHGAGGMKNGCQSTA